MKADFKALRSWTLRNRGRLAALATMTSFAEVPGTSSWEIVVNGGCVPLIGSRVGPDRQSHLLAFAV